MEFRLPDLVELDDGPPGIYELRWPELDHGKLPDGLVEQILRVQFKPDGEYRAAIRYCAMMAEQERKNPLLQDFDTVIRDMLHEASVTYVRMFFGLLRDCIEPHARLDVAEPMYWWGRLATYLYWSGRTGRGLVVGFAGMDGAFAKHLPELYATLRSRLEEVPEE